MHYPKSMNEFVITNLILQTLTGKTLSKVWSRRLFFKFCCIVTITLPVNRLSDSVSTFLIVFLNAATKFNRKIKKMLSGAYYLGALKG